MSARRAAARLTAIAVVVIGLPSPASAQDVDPPPARERLAPPVDVRLRVVPDPLPPGGPEPTVGDSVWATVRAFGPRGTYLLPASVVAAYAPRPELAVLGTERRDGQLRLRLALFRPGDVVLPTVEARVATAAGETLAVPVQSDTFRIASVLAPGDTLLADIKPLWPEPGPPPWFWIAVALVVALLLAAFWWWRRRRRRDEHAQADAMDPYEDARHRIEALSVDPPEPAPRIAAAAGIGDALRDYLAGRWETSARERTTLEILSALPAPLAVSRASLGSVLSEVDLAKFARLAPRPGRVPALADRALAVLDGLEAAHRPPVATEAAS